MSQRTLSDPDFLDAVSSLVCSNPFSPEWVMAEHRAAGLMPPRSPQVHHLEEGDSYERSNLTAITEKSERVAANLQDRLARGAKLTELEFEYYRGLILYILYRRYRLQFDDLIDVASAGALPPRVTFWNSFLEDFHRFTRLPSQAGFQGLDPGHIFACFFQIRRAFREIFLCIAGRSKPATRLRADVWNSIFTHDMRRYVRKRYRCMKDISTLITGPSGTGKELVARAIGFSQYIPFNENEERFTANFMDSLHALNLPAMPPTLIESELFGHDKGAFTDATQARAGWLEQCQVGSTVFLDEIGEVATTIQVKLLRVLETRRFQRIGETTDRSFKGKVIAATNRDLGLEMRAGRFREDLYYRLCSDTIVTPSLREQLDDAPEELHDLIRFIVRRVVSNSSEARSTDDEDESNALTEEVQDVIQGQLGSDYRWPGNIRELEQCVRSVMVRSTYNPQPPAGGSPEDQLRDALDAIAAEGRLSAQELERLYIMAVYQKGDTYKEAAKILGCDYRKVREVVALSQNPPNHPR